jgi:hypothetical protein
MLPVRVHMPLFFRTICFLVVLFISTGSGMAQDLPPNLKAIASQLGKKRATSVVFASTGQTTAPACGLAPFRVTLTRGPNSTSYSVLSEPGDQVRRQTIFAVTDGLAADADGSPRAYHPEDPTGTGKCELNPGRNGALVPSGPACALDQFTSGSIAVFTGTTPLADKSLKEDWLQFWSLIRNHKLPSHDLAEVLGESFGYHYYFFYWKEKDMSVFFKDENFQRTAGGYPCIHGQASRYAGYFVSATTLKHDTDHPGAEVATPAEIAPPECLALRNIDSETTAFFVIPGGTLGDATIGDVVVARLKRKVGGKDVYTYAYGVAADEGPISKFGEGSALFNQKLLGKSGPVMNVHGLNALDFDQANVAILILGGTRDLLKGDFSQSNVESVAKTEFARWGGNAEPTTRLEACAAVAGPPNPRSH